MTEHGRPQLRVVEIGTDKPSNSKRSWSLDQLLDFAKEIALIENQNVNGINKPVPPNVQTTEIYQLSLVTETANKK